MIKKFERGGFKVHAHRMLPNNDGCISYGQVIVGNEKSR
jgi:hydrogenase maturation factor HypF (carbamoyltransferase family)